MQPPSIKQGLAAGLPLTHQTYIAACNTELRRPNVQVRRRFSGRAEVLCGQVSELVSSDQEWFKVDTWVGIVWADGRNVRLCSGDGRCTCEPDSPSTSKEEGVPHRAPHPVRDVAIGDRPGPKHSERAQARKNRWRPTAPPLDHALQPIEGSPC